MPRTEREIFGELAQLCISPGYVHALALLSLRDNVVLYSGKLTAKDTQHLFSMERLIRTELSTLIGLMVKAPIDYQLPASNVLSEYVKRSDELLAEMHAAIAQQGVNPTEWERMAEEDSNPFEQGAVLRESIFYSGESAYSFQYRDFAPLKYHRDNEWLERHKGFSIETARVVADAIGRLQEHKLGYAARLRKARRDNWSALPGFAFSVEEISQYSGLEPKDIDSVLASLTLAPDERNAEFKALSDFNIVNAKPFLRIDDRQFLLLQSYALLEALYEAPFYWMGADDSYKATALENRGKFTEEFALGRLEAVFGKACVYANVDVHRSRKRRIGEIDVLVAFGDRAIVLQAKSKRLTLESRKGNDLQIKTDFRDSVQKSYDQGYLCATALNDATHKLFDASGNEIIVPRRFKEIYILCAVSDHYPALSFQVRQFLKIQQSEVIRAPFILDVFTLDALAEMLESPLRFLSYLNRRAVYADRVVSMHELTILSYHLKRNLWLEDDASLMMLSPDISADLDVAMAVRRDGIEGKRSPDGVLTRLNGTPLGMLVDEIEARADPATIDLGFLLLTIGEGSIGLLNKAIDRIATMARRDGKNHDVTIGLGSVGSGLTVHCNDLPDPIAAATLEDHCERRKYSEKASTWFGVCLRSTDAKMRLGLQLKFPWVQNTHMDTLTQGMPRPMKLPEAIVELKEKRTKIGRNDPCPCGSGRKYKRCCQLS